MPAESPESLAVEVTDLRTFAQKVKADIADVLGPTLQGMDDEVMQQIFGKGHNQALGNSELYPAGQLIGAGIELNLRESVDHLRQVVSGMAFLAEVAEIMADEYEGIDAQNGIDIGRFGEFATQARTNLGEHPTGGQP